MPKAYDFQTIIMKLQEFWASQGCLIWQPYYVQVGAGTMNPGTALRVLGPEPWRVAYVEPSIRPDDGRYGENPNRMQMHYQMQVILKPDPGNPQEIYLGSLQALGIDPRQHDIRFVEDNWKSPALAAWGLGWEVWMDGQEITQFTYFQQSGGQTLTPVSVELTYGLERIAIALQQVNSFRDIQWNEQFTDGDVNLQAEQEHSRYYFEIADVEHLRQMYDLFETEAKACLEQRLVLPAHDYVLKCSHTFNILDTRGAIGVTERQAYFARMRDLSRAVAEAYIEQRQSLEFPWLDDESAQAGAQPSAAQSRPALSVHAQADTLLFEIGTEELPVADLDTSLEAIRQLAPSKLEELRLDYESLQVLGTPRRLVLIVENLAPTQRDLEQVVKGPPAERAFDSDGAPTKAAQGFARSKGVQVSDLEVRETDGGRYVTAVVRESGRPAVEVLAEALPDLIASLRFEQSMRWNDTNVAFSRPIRWLLALYGDQVVPFSYAGLESGKLTHGLRFNDPAEFPIDNTRDYMEQMRAQGILLDFEERRANIRAQVETLAAQVDGIIPEDPRLLDEVTNLVEAPAALLGSFDPEHLALPREVLISVMKKHQRYFPVQKKDRLLPYFITVANKPSLGPNKCEGAEMIIDGNEHVVRARFTDAAYFVRQDLKSPLADYLSRLDTLTFQTKLGSMLDKTGRIRKLVEDLIPMFDLDETQAKVARRAAELCKADLVTSMVVEMTSLQGVMGSHYALTSGEPEPVALAIYDHYLPRFAGDQTAQTRPGLVIGLADRLDTLTGLFAAGLAPTGNKDPFAQRRAALGLVQNLLTWDLDFDLDAAIAMAAIHQPIEADENVESEVAEFIIERLRNILLDDGWRYDIVDAVLSVQGGNPAAALRAVRELNTWVERPEWDEILPAYARCVRITRDLGTVYELDPNGFTETASQDLYAALIGAERAERVPGSVDDFLNAFTPMIPAINRFFDKVLVMAEEKSVRHNRLALLQRIAALAQSAADMSRLEGF